eukprot:1533046-Rhodomonas_salina.2
MVGLPVLHKPLERLRGHVTQSVRGHVTQSVTATRHPITAPLNLPHTRTNQLHSAPPSSHLQPLQHIAQS